ncbi:DUF6622 family protein [Ferrovibrio sp.]|uniref:DUF6622 family protein n=1 Tax=Ferrovibrio sp. TaxID=1917215 RepID=UPI000CAF5BF7|nr:DUF6622 family protein [Ferrovibrio sp.]PJI43814.1 MAG: hypothetical protein CTR53_02040 [Ferrovibrio sp.]
MTTFLGYATGILANTPLWVWALLALLIWLGSLGLKSRRMALRRVAIVPVVFVIWGLSGLAARPFEAGIIAALWLGGLILGATLGLATGPQLLGVDRTRREVELPASGWPLARNLIIFFAHYALIVTAAILTAQKAMLLQADIAVSGASAGYFIGWFVALLRQYRAAGAGITASAL